MKTSLTFSVLFCVRGSTRDRGAAVGDGGPEESEDESDAAEGRTRQGHLQQNR